MMRTAIPCIIALCVVCTQAIASFPAYVGSGPIQEITDEFAPVYGSGQASVTSKVYEGQDGDYIYAYLISDSTAKFTWFSVALDPAISVNSWDYDLPGTAPAIWAPVDSPATSIEAFFAAGLTSGDSAVLWFTSSNAPVLGTGALARLSYTGGTYAVGDVLVPVPEPVTAILLGVGWLAVRSYRRKT